MYEILANGMKAKLTPTSTDFPDSVPGNIVRDPGNYFWIIYYPPLGTVSETLSYDDPAVEYRFDINSIFNYGDNHGWTFDWDGNITIPLDRTYAPLGDYTVRMDVNNGNPDPDLSADGKYFAFEIVCLLVDVLVSKATSSKIEGTDPQQYQHVYLAQAKVYGGTRPFTYTWSNTEGDFDPVDPTGDTVKIIVINESPNDGDVAGAVNCIVEDSDGCSDENSAGYGGAPGCAVGPYPCDGTNSGTTVSECGFKQHCVQVLGNNTAGGSQS